MSNDITSQDFENRVGKAYRDFSTLAQRYHYTFARPAVTPNSLPVALFLGNHSSGKSSLVNWVLGGVPVQDTGVAPTDDGFTVLLHGETEEDISGPAALARLPSEFKALEIFGSTLLQRLKIKVRNREILKKVYLVDSPGMIDAAEGTVSRDYDFPAVTRRFTELCDMVFFLFDPEKPGTTGETVNVFSKCLQGIEYKLWVLLNKCDTLTSNYDFARTYGAVCWNLARVLHTKDLPKIFTTYSGTEREQSNTGLNLTDFNRHRTEFLTILSESAARRRDNVFASAENDFRRLAIRMRILNHAVRRLANLTFMNFFVGLLVTLLTALASFIVIDSALASKNGITGVVPWLAAGAATILTVLSVYGWNRISVRFLRWRLSRDVDGIFSAEYHDQMAVGVHDDLRQHWEALRAETAEVILKAPLHLPVFRKRKQAKVEAFACRLASDLIEAHKV